MEDTQGMEYLLSFRMKKNHDKDVPCVVFNYSNGKMKNEKFYIHFDSLFVFFN